jgi:hypothetical protein
MKLSQKQLRRIINEVASKRISEARPGPSHNEYDELGGSLAGAVVDKLTRNVQATVDAIAAHVSPDVVLPARLEDVDAVAEELADMAMPMIKDAVEQLAAHLLRSLMSPE